MEAEDAQCHLLYSKERVTIAREGGLMLTEERDVRRGCKKLPPNPEVYETRVKKGNQPPCVIHLNSNNRESKQAKTKFATGVTC